MDTIQAREARYKRLYWALIAMHYVLGVALVIIYARISDGYHLGISLGTLVVVPLIPLFYRLFRLKEVYQLNFLTLMFIFLAYPLGSCVDLYKLLPGFDKLVHTLSGVFVSLLCMILYCALKPDHKIARADAPLAIVFVFFGSMAVAGLWEVAEYIASFFVGRDLQRVALTGVGDSMQDMIVCLVGTILTLPFVYRLACGKIDFITGAVESFVAKNCAEQAA